MSDGIRRTGLATTCSILFIKVATKYLFYFVSIVVFFSCEKEHSSPFDPETPRAKWTPSEFTAVQDENTILLSWKQDETNIDGFKIERKKEESNWAIIASLANSITSWNDTLITGGKLHEYKLFAFAGENRSNTITTSCTPILTARISLGTATDISTTSFVVNGSINANGTPTTATFFYKEESETTWKSVKANTNSLSGNSWVAVSAGIFGLTPGKTYQFKLKAASSAGEIESEVQSVTLGCNEALTEIISAEKISETSFQLRGKVNASGSPTEVSFEYGETTDFGQNTLASQATVTGNTFIDVNVTLTDLKENTVYYYRLKAKSCGGTVYSAISEFGEQCEPPDVKINSATNQTAVGAKIHASINAWGKSTIITFEYGKTENLGLSIQANQSPVITTRNTSVSASLADLEPCTKYYFRVKAESCGGTQYSSVSSFETSGVAASPSILAATEITANSARLNGKLIANGSPTRISFQYGEDQDYKNSVEATPNEVSGSNSENVTVNISGLKPCTTYYYRIKTENCSGMAYSSGSNFKTIGTSPVAEILPADIISPFSVKLNGKVNAMGALTSVLFEYGKTTNMGNTVISSPSSLKGNGLSHVSANINGLEPDSKYFFRIKAVNCGEVVSSNIEEFQTPVAFSVTPDRRDVNYKSGETMFKVESNDKWTYEITKGNNWMEASKKGKSEIEVSYSGNPTTGVREGRLRVSSSGKDLTVLLIQAAAPCIFDVSPNSRTVPTFTFLGAGITSFRVDACVKWSVKDDAKWLKAEKSGDNTISVTFSSNFTNENRTASITVQGEDGLEEVVTVTQAAYNQ